MAPPPVATLPSVADDDAELDRLIKDLKSPDAGRAFTAALHLGKLGDVRALPALVDALRTSEDLYTRLGATIALGELKSADAVPSLIEVAGDHEDLLRKGAAEALELITLRSMQPESEPKGEPQIDSRAGWTRWWKEHEQRVRRGLEQAK